VGRNRETRTSGDRFPAGSTDEGASVIGGAEPQVILRPGTMADFTGEHLPVGWTVNPYQPGGSGRLGDGEITLDGAWVGCDSVFRGPRRTVDFSATFSARPDQHAGFGLDYISVPWVMFSTKWGRRLYARTHHVLIEDKKAPGDWFGRPHHFRIAWDLLDITFFIDGERAAYLLVPVPGYMRAVAGNQRVGGPPLHIQWMRVSPYATAGTFTSAPLDAGATVEWLDATCEADLPPATSVRLSVRTGDVGLPGPAWSAWKPLDGTTGAVEATSRYLQYRAELATKDAGTTPVLKEVTFRHRR